MDSREDATLIRIKSSGSGLEGSFASGEAVRNGYQAQLLLDQAQWDEFEAIESDGWADVLRAAVRDLSRIEGGSALAEQFQDAVNDAASAASELRQSAADKRKQASSLQYSGGGGSPEDDANKPTHAEIARARNRMQECKTLEDRIGEASHQLNFKHWPAWQTAATNEISGFQSMWLDDRGIRENTIFELRKQLKKPGLTKAAMAKIQAQIDITLKELRALFQDYSNRKVGLMKDLNTDVQQLREFGSKIKGYSHDSGFLQSMQGFTIGDIVLKPIDPQGHKYTKDRD
jgi:hypothetical protein